MLVFEDSALADLAAIEPSARRKYEAAIRLASLGVRVFPSAKYDGEAFYRAKAEYEEERDKARADKSYKPKLTQSHFKRFGGKAPAFPKQYTLATCDLDQVAEWFHPETGQYADHNICVATGRESGLVVVDIDVKEGGDDGFIWWNDLVAEHGDVDTFRVRSGGESQGGQHIYFLYREGVFTRNGLARGIDIRVEDSHVMGPFSECQGTYEVLTNYEVAELPDWLFEAMNHKGPSQKEEKQGKGPTADSGHGLPAISLAQIRDMLEYLDPNDDEIDGKWKSIMYAIHSEHPNEHGLQALQEWSARNPDRYDPAQNESMWNRANDERGNATTARSLVFLAEERGWVNPNRGTTKISMGDCVRMMNKSFHIIDRDRYIHSVAAKGASFDRSKMPPGHIPPMTIFKSKAILHHEKNFSHRCAKVEEVTTNQVRMLTSHYRVEVKNPSTNKTAMKDPFTVWMESPARASHYAAGYYIDNKNKPDGVINLFPGFVVSPTHGKPEMFLWHVENIICRGDKARFDWVMNRLAYMIQFGDKIMPTSLVITGKHGSGKSIIADYIGRILGAGLSYKYLSDAAALESRFSEELVGQFLVVADEAIFAGDPKLRNKLKSMIAAEVLRDEGKGKAAKDQMNVMFLMILSNEDDPAAVEQGDRRFTILNTSNVYSREARLADPEVDKMAADYFKRLANEMNTTGPSDLLGLLMTWEVNLEAARNALETEEKTLTIEHRNLKTDSILSFIYYLYSTGFDIEDPEDQNSPQEGWGGTSRMGAMHSRYMDWAKGQAIKSSEWKVKSIAEFKQRLSNDFGCKMAKPRNQSTIYWPKRKEIESRLLKWLPDMMKIEIAERDPDPEPAVEPKPAPGPTPAAVPAAVPAAAPVVKEKPNKNEPYDPSKETDF